MLFVKDFTPRWLMLALFGGCFVVSPAVQAANPKGTPASAVSKSNVQVTDVVLHKGGLLVGSFVGDKGEAVKANQVALRKDGKVIATATTNDKGQFGIRGLRSGVYEVATARGNGFFRLWSKETAPPSAHPAVIIVAGNEVLRGQYEEERRGTCTLFDPQSPAYQALTLGLGAGGLATGIIALTEDDNGS